MDSSGTRIRLPREVADIYRAVEALAKRYPGRPFTPDGHMVGSIGEVVAAEAFGLELYPPSQAVHDAYDSAGDVQIKITAGRHVSMYSCCDRLLVLRIVSPKEAEVIYDGPGTPAWAEAGGMQKNGQRRISLTKLRAISTADLRLNSDARGRKRG
jgi:hypothetical protein